jgi:hypothetical protein
MAMAHSRMDDAAATMISERIVSSFEAFVSLEGKEDDEIPFVVSMSWSWDGVRVGPSSTRVIRRRRMAAHPADLSSSSSSVAWMSVRRRRKN